MAGTSVDHAEQSRTAVPAEGNFEEHPYFRVGDRNAGTGTLQYDNELRTRDGNILKQSWVVRAVHGMGLPGRYDQDVYVALLQLIDNRGLPQDGWLSFSIYELVELMGKRHSGREYQHVRESLQKLATTSIESKNAFYHKGRKAYISDTFSLLTEVKLVEYEGLAGQRRDRNRVHLSDYFVDSYKANYLKSIDVRFYWSLSSPIAKRLYRLIDKKRSGRRSWEVDLFSLKERIPLSDYRYASKIKEKLSPAHEELVAKGFLESASYRKTEGREYAVYEITEGFHERRSAVARHQFGVDELFCIQRLSAEGMAREVAEQLVADYGSKRAMHYVEALPYQKNLRNPAGWLRKAIENGYELDMPLPLATAPAGEDEEPLSGLASSGPAPEGPNAGGEAAGEAGAAPPPLLPLAAPEPDASARELWERVLADASTRVDDSNLEFWFDTTVPVALGGETLTLWVPTAAGKDYIASRFRASVEASLRACLSPGARLELTCPSAP